MTLSQIAADPRAETGEEFTAEGKCRVRIDDCGFFMKHTQEFGLVYMHIKAYDVLRTDWYFLKDGPGEWEA